MTNILIFASLFLSATIMGCMYRAIKGPTSADRLIAINVISTKTIILILIISIIIHETYFVDVAIVYALIGFVASVVIANYIQNIGGKEK